MPVGARRCRRCAARHEDARPSSAPASAGSRSPSACSRRASRRRSSRRATSPAAAPISGRRTAHVFDAGPTVITDPDCLQELWALTGARHGRRRRADAGHALLPADLARRDELRLFERRRRAATPQIAALNPADVAGYRRFLDYSAGVYREGYEKLGAVPFLDFASMMQGRARARSATRPGARSIRSSRASCRTRSCARRCRFHTLLVGGNPMTTSAIYALIHKLERDGGVWFARGGTNALVAGMVRHFERLGGTIRLGDPVDAIETDGDRATGGARPRAAGAASSTRSPRNGDVVHSYATCSTAIARRADGRAKLRAQALLALAVRRPFRDARAPGRTSPTTSILFGPRYEGLLGDIYDHGVLPDDPRSTSTTRPSPIRRMAPPGMSTFYALAPVPHLGKLPVDWAARSARSIAKRILDDVEQRLIPDLRDRIVDQLPLHAAAISRTISARISARAFSLEPTADPERLVPRPQSRRRDPQPLFRRRRHASRRRHSRRGRQRQGDRRADDRGPRAGSSAPSLVAEAERIIREGSKSLPLRQQSVRPGDARARLAALLPGAAPATTSPTARRSATTRSRRRSRSAGSPSRARRPTARWPARRSAIAPFDALARRRRRMRDPAPLHRRSSRRLRARRRGLAAANRGRPAALLLPCRRRGRLHDGGGHGGRSRTTRTRSTAPPISASPSSSPTSRATSSRIMASAASMSRPTGWAERARSRTTAPRWPDCGAARRAGRRAMRPRPGSARAACPSARAGRCCRRPTSTARSPARSWRAAPAPGTAAP